MKLLHGDTKAAVKATDLDKLFGSDTTLIAKFGVIKTDEQAAKRG